MFAPIVMNSLMVITVNLAITQKCIFNLLYIKDMSKETKDSIAVRQHMEAVANAANAYYKADDENRAVFQILVERKDGEDLGKTGCTLLGYGSLLTMGIDNAIDNYEEFRKSLIIALGRRSSILGMLLMTMFSDPNKEEE